MFPLLQPDSRETLNSPESLNERKSAKKIEPETTQSSICLDGIDLDELEKQLEREREIERNCYETARQIHQRLMEDIEVREFNLLSLEDLMHFAPLFAPKQANTVHYPPRLKQYSLNANEGELKYAYEQLAASKKSQPSADKFLQAVGSVDFFTPTLRNFDISDVNLHLKDLISDTVTDSLWPLNARFDNCSFYTSFSQCYLAFEDGAQAFRDAVIRRALLAPNAFRTLCSEFREDPNDVLNSMRYPSKPTHTELALLSQIVNRNISVFEFNEEGSVVSDIFYDYGLGNCKASTTFLGCTLTDSGSYYFPLVRKNYLEREPLEAKTSALSFIQMTEARDSTYETSSPAKPFDSTGIQITEISSTLETLEDLSADNERRGGYFNDPLVTFPPSLTCGNETPREAAPITKCMFANQSPSTHVFPSEGAVKPSISLSQGPAANHSRLPQNVSSRTITRPTVPPPQPPQSSPGYKMGHEIASWTIGSDINLIKPHGPAFLQIMPAERPQHGLPNTGQTCYVNALLQSIFALPPVIDHQLPQVLSNFYDAIYKKSISALDYQRNLHQLKAQMLSDTHLMEDREQDCDELFMELLNDASMEDVKNVFNIAHEEESTCVECKAGRTLPTATQVRYEVHPNIPVQEELDRVTNNATIRDYNCEQCTGIERKVTTTAISPPECLLLTTMLFSGDLTKIPTSSNFQPELQPLLFSTSGGTFSYKLRSFITHTGRTQFHGHYKAYVLRNDGWVCADDKIIKKPERISPSEAIYMRFYVRSQETDLNNI